MEQLLNVIYWNEDFFWELYETCKHALWAKWRDSDITLCIAYSNHQALKDSVKSTGQRTAHNAGVSQWLGICHFCHMDYVKHVIAGNIELCVIRILHATLGSHKAKMRLHGVQNVH
jgi:hypothetical protein